MTNHCHDYDKASHFCIYMYDGDDKSDGLLYSFELNRTSITVTNENDRGFSRLTTSYCTKYSIECITNIYRKCDAVLAKMARLLVPKRWRDDHTSAKRSICPAPAHWLNNLAVNLMRMLCCLESVTWATSDYDVSTSVLYSPLKKGSTH